MHSPADIETKSGAVYARSAIQGYMSGLSDAKFLEYAIAFKDHPVVRRSFFSRIGERTSLSADEADRAAALLLDEIVARRDRSRNEALLRRLVPLLSTQMRTRAFRDVLESGTKAARAYLLRWTTPDDAPGIQELVLQLAIDEKDEDALVGISYRWPLPYWSEKAVPLAAAAVDFPWVQRRIILNVGNPDEFLSKKIICDAVTELYLRARYNRPIDASLISTALDDVATRPTQYADDRSGLVAWCLGRIGAFREIRKLEEAKSGYGGDLRERDSATG